MPRYIMLDETWKMVKWSGFGKISGLSIILWPPYFLSSLSLTRSNYYRVRTQDGIVEDVLKWNIVLRRTASPWERELKAKLLQMLQNWSVYTNTRDTPVGDTPVGVLVYFSHWKGRNSFWCLNMISLSLSLSMVYKPINKGASCTQSPMGPSKENGGNRTWKTFIGANLGFIALRK